MCRGEYIEILNGLNFNGGGANNLGTKNTRDKNPKTIKDKNRDEFICGKAVKIVVANEEWSIIVMLQIEVPTMKGQFSCILESIFMLIKNTPT